MISLQWFMREHTVFFCSIGDYHCVQLCNGENESLENVVMYVVVALAAFSAQLNLGTEDFDVAGLGTTGCFAAMFIGYLSCMAFSKLRRCHKLMLEQYTAGMGGGCVSAIRTLIPLGIVAAGSGGLNLLIGRITGIYGCYQWFNHIFYAAFQNIADYSNFLSGLLYTFAVNLMWFFGLHGSHILEAVAVHNFGVTGNVVFQRHFTMCMWQWEAVAQRSVS